MDDRGWTMVSDEGDHHVHGVAHLPDEFVGLRLYDGTYQEAVENGSEAERLIEREQEKAEAIDDGRSGSETSTEEESENEEDGGYEGGETYSH